MTGAYQGEQWRQARRAAMARDNQQCQDCGQTDDLHAHHIKPVREFENAEDAHYLENLVILCKYCHKRWEGVDARPKLAEAETGTTVNEVVADLTLETLKRESFAAAIPEIYWRYLACSPGRCTNCFREIDGPTKRFLWSSFVATLANAIDIYPGDVSPSNFSRTRRTVVSKCEDCSRHTDGSKTDAREARLNEISHVIRLLGKWGVPFSEQELKERYVDWELPKIRGGKPTTLQAAISMSVVGKYYIPATNELEAYCSNLEYEDYDYESGSSKESYLQWYKSEMSKLEKTC